MAELRRQGSAAAVATLGASPGAVRALGVGTEWFAARSGNHDPHLWPWRAELVEVAAKLGADALAREVSAKLDDDTAADGSNKAAQWPRAPAVSSHSLRQVHTPPRSSGGQDAILA